MGERETLSRERKGEEMNKWLGFSLTPHLRISDRVQEEDEENYVATNQQKALMPHSDGSPFFTDPLTHHPHPEVPKLEDFSSNSHQTECPPISGNYQTNVNCTTMLNRLSPHGYLLCEQTVSTPQYSNLDTNLSRDYGGSVSVFKSWLGQGTPTFPVSNTYVSGEGSTSNTSNFSHEETDYNTSGSTLLLTMSHGAASDLINELNVSVPVEEPVKVDEKRKSLVGKSQAKEPVETRKSVDSLGQRTSQYRGVTKHRWTGRYEAHLWDNSCKKEGQSRRGRQGGYDDEEKAARAYDLAAMKYWGPTTHLNFPLSNYEKEIEELNNMTRQEFVAMLRR
ncbi:hypothetical protein YC2023_016802 [Brassica napus]